MIGNQPRLAVHCQFLKRAYERERLEPLVALCQHPIREGKECIGPFLEDLATTCGLWEAHPQAHLIPLPQPERWSFRGRTGRRREGFDYRGGWR